MGASVPAAERIYLSSPDVTEAEEVALVRAFRSGWIAPLGPEVDAFEDELAAYAGRQHAVALSSGTAALHLALLAVGVRPEDVVLTSSMTFAATAYAIVYVGAQPVFVDCDSTGNMNPELLEAAFLRMSQSGRHVAAVLPVDLFGKVVDHDRIDAIAAEHGVPVVSDAAESLGAVRHGRQSVSYGVAAAVSFNGNKIMTTSGGGALLTDDADMASQVRNLATQARLPVVHYEHAEIGYNYRLSNLLAALGRAQLQRLDAMIEQRRRIRLYYKDLFADVPGVSLFGEPSGTDGGDTRDNFWLTSVLVDPQEAAFESDDFRRALALENIEVRPQWKPMHLQPVFANAPAIVDGTSEFLFRHGLSLPSGSGLTDAQLVRITDAVTRFLGAHHG